MNIWKCKYQTKYRMIKLDEVLYGCKIVKKLLENWGRGEEECSQQKHKCRNMLGEWAGGGHNQHLGIKSNAETMALIAAAISCVCAPGVDSRRQAGALLILCGGDSICFWLLSTELSNPLTIDCWQHLHASIHCPFKMRRTRGFYNLKVCISVLLLACFASQED